MKKNNIIISVLFIVYIIISLSIPLKSYIYGNNGDVYNEKYYKRRYGYDNTNEVNASIISAVKGDTYYGHRYINIFASLKYFTTDIYKQNVKYYITNLNDVDKLIKYEKISNEYNIDFKNPKFTLPMKDKDYAHIFEDIFTTEKQEAKVIGKDEKGYSLFDISPDALIFATVDGTIVSYAYIDNRLLDTREFMNKAIDVKNVYKANFKENYNGVYNKYKLDFYEDEDEFTEN